MTTPDERMRAVLQTREFLRELTDSRVTPRVPANVRRSALVLLRHYPSESDMEIVHLACPQWFASTNDADIARHLDSFSATYAHMRSPVFKAVAKALEATVAKDVGFGRFRGRK